MAFLYLRYVESGIPFLFHGLLCVLAYIIWASIVLLVLPVFTAFRIYKLIGVALTKLTKLAIVNITDLPFLFESQENKNFINAFISASGECNVKKLRRWVEERILDNENVDDTYKRLKQRVCTRYLNYVWTDEDDFNIRRHMPVYNGRIPENKNDLQQIFAELASDSFPKDISPWMMKIIPMKDKKSFYIHVKIHHVLGDGFAMVGLLSNLVDEKPHFIKPTVKRKGFMDSPIRRTMSALLTGPLALLAVMFSTPSMWLNPFKPKSPPVKKMIGWSMAISLEYVKKIKDQAGATVNDVVLSSFAGALHRYLKTDIDKNPSELPISMTFNSRSMKAKDVDQIPLENRSGGVFLQLPTSVEDPMQRLSIVKDRISSMKDSSDPHVFSWIYFTLLSCLPEYFARMCTFSIRDNCCLIFSNVPGPVKPLNINGQRIDSVIVIPPLHADIGIVAAAFSYAGSLNLTVMTDQMVIEDPDRLTKYFEEEVHLLGERLLLTD